MNKCSIDECCIEYHEAIAHLSKKEVEELVQKENQMFEEPDLKMEEAILINQRYLILLKCMKDWGLKAQEADLVIKIYV